MAPALAMQADKGRISLPRRVAWVVDRRVVVDQATEEAARLLAQLHEKPELMEIRAALDSVSGAGPLAISTLRGELEDNREWSTHPARPAIIVGTIDMIGSRLLFSG